MAEYDDSTFLGTDVPFSSYTYLIDAVRCLGKVLAVNRSDWTQANVCSPQTFEDADISLTNWTLHLPSTKQEFVGHEEHIDEVLYRARLTVNL